LLRLCALHAEAAVSPTGDPEAADDARQLLGEKIAEQESFVEKMRTYRDIGRRGERSA
jgi:hypothetical protein